MNSELIMEGLEALRSAERQEMSRILHDEVGPSLCSAGLMLGIACAGTESPDGDEAELLESLRGALESAVSKVRAMSYQSDPGLASRCGLRAALEYLATGAHAGVQFDAAFTPWPGEQAEAACRLVRDVLLCWRGPDVCIRALTGRIALRTATHSAIPPDRLAALRWRANQAGLEILYEEFPAETFFSVIYGGES